MFIDTGGVKMDKNDQKDRNKSFPNISPKDYFEANGSVKTDLFEDKAEKIASSFRYDNTGKIKGTQIRKFYDEVLRLKLKIESADNPDEKFKEILPYIKMLIPKVVYSKNKNTVNGAFENFIKNNIREIRRYKEFMVFCDLFECVVAYCKEYCKDT
jgi:CRISPR-associated protein Csm2